MIRTRPGKRPRRRLLTERGGDGDCFRASHPFWRAAWNTVVPGRGDHRHRGGTVPGRNPGTGTELDHVSYSAYLTLFLALAAKVGRFPAVQRVPGKRPSPFPVSNRSSTRTNRKTRPIHQGWNARHHGCPRPLLLIPRLRSTTLLSCHFFANGRAVRCITVRLASGKTRWGFSLRTASLPGSIRLGGRETFHTHPV
jgi:hypothetical protein